MNGEISKDSFGVALSFLDIKSIKQLRKTNKLNKKYINKFSHIILEKELVEVWGCDLIKLLKNHEDDFRKNIKKIHKEYIKKTPINQMAFYIMFLKNICENKNNFVLKHGLFMSIYDICYIFCTSHDYNLMSYDSPNNWRNKLKYARSKFILENFTQEEVIGKHKALINILNITRQIDRNYAETTAEYNRETVIQELFSLY